MDAKSATEAELMKQALTWIKNDNAEALAREIDCGTLDPDSILLVGKDSAEWIVEDAEVPLLVLAVRHRSIACLRLLLDSDADPDVKGVGGREPLHELARIAGAPWIEGAKLLLEYDANVVGSAKINLFEACYTGKGGLPERVELARLLIEKKADVNETHKYATGETTQPLLYTVCTMKPRRECTDLVKLLLDSKANVNYIGKESAAPGTGKEAVSLGFNKQRTALSMALRANLPKTVKTLLAAKDIDLDRELQVGSWRKSSTQMSLLCYAASCLLDYSDLDCSLLDDLVNAGCDVDQPIKKSGTTALHLVCERAKRVDKRARAVVGRLLMLGGNPSIRDVDGMTPLDHLTAGNRDIAAAIRRAITRRKRIGERRLKAEQEATAPLPSVRSVLEDELLLEELEPSQPKKKTKKKKKKKRKDGKETALTPDKDTGNEQVSPDPKTPPKPRSKEQSPEKTPSPPHAPSPKKSDPRTNSKNDRSVRPLPAAILKPSPRATSSPAGSRDNQSGKLSGSPPPPGKPDDWQPPGWNVVSRKRRDKNSHHHDPNPRKPTVQTSGTQAGTSLLQGGSSGSAAQATTTSNSASASTLRNKQRARRPAATPKSPPHGPPLGAGNQQQRLGASQHQAHPNSSHHASLSKPRPPPPPPRSTPPTSWRDALLAPGQGSDATTLSPRSPEPKAASGGPLAGTPVGSQHHPRGPGLPSVLEASPWGSRSASTGNGPTSVPKNVSEWQDALMSPPREKASPTTSSDPKSHEQQHGGLAKSTGWGPPRGGPSSNTLQAPAPRDRPSVSDPTMPSAVRTCIDALLSDGTPVFYRSKHRPQPEAIPAPDRGPPPLDPEDPADTTESRLRALLAQRDAELAAKIAQLHAKDASLAAKDSELTNLVEKVRMELFRKDTQLRELHTDVATKQRTIEFLELQLQNAGVFYPTTGHHGLTGMTGSGSSVGLPSTSPGGPSTSSNPGGPPSAPSALQPPVSSPHPPPQASVVTLPARGPGGVGAGGGGNGLPTPEKRLLHQHPQQGPPSRQQLKSGSPLAPHALPFQPSGSSTWGAPSYPKNGGWGQPPPPRLPSHQGGQPSGWGPPPQSSPAHASDLSGSFLPRHLLPP